MTGRDSWQALYLFRGHYKADPFASWPIADDKAACLDFHATNRASLTHLLTRKRILLHYVSLLSASRVLCEEDLCST